MEIAQRWSHFRSALALRTRLRVGLTAARGVDPFAGVGDSGYLDMALPESAVAGLLANADNDLERLLYDNPGRPVHKWIHYPAVYDRHLSRYRGTNARFLEIGVDQGGSLDLWRRYLGPDAVIHGLDINPECATRVTPPNVVHIASQTDQLSLRAIAREMGGLDVVLDDGSHVGEHQWASFETLFPLLAEGGLYIIEDLHTSYWRSHERLGTHTSGIALIEQVIQDMHGWYHQLPRVTPARDWVPAVHVYDSITVIEKSPVPPPRRIGVPGTKPT